MEDNYIKGLGTIVTLLILLAARRRKKEAKAREEDVRNYVPIEPETSDSGTRVFSALTKMLRAYSFLIGIGIVGAMLLLSAAESVDRWIIFGIAALVLLVFLIYMNRKAEEAPGRTDIERHS